MKLLLKQNLKEQLQRTKQTARNKASRTDGSGYREILEPLRKLCRHRRILIP